MDEIIKQSTELYYEIDDCITKLIKARLDKDANKENEAIYYMESLLVSTMQHISWMVNELKGNSKIQWQTGEPKENDVYLVSLVFGNSVVTTFLNYYRGVWLNLKSSEFPSEYVKAWCKLSDIKPYKEETK